MRRPTLLIRLTVIVVAAIYGLVLYVQGVQLDAPIQRALSALPVVALALLWVWDVVLWHIPPLHLLTKRPYIAGLWKVSLMPDVDAQIPPGGNRGPIEAYIVIRQTFWSTSVVQFSRESRSESDAVNWSAQANGVDRLSFTYKNVPKVSESARSVRSNGVCDLGTEVLAPRSIDGSYYTDRYTKGDMELTLIDRSTNYGRFADAKQHAEAVGGSKR